MRRYLMIGAPVTSVRTPPLLAAFLAEHGVTATVEPRHVEPEALAAVMAAVHADPQIDGLMVTMPHKRAVCRHLDGLTESARAAGSVNAVKREGERLVGAQFDGIGLLGALLAAGVEPRRARILLAGLGGAGLAIAQALLAHGCAALTVVETDAARLAAVGPSLAGPVALLAPGAALPAADVLINATPLGMKPGDASPFPADAMARARCVADIVAIPNETRLADLARRAGVALVTGHDMVTHQVAPIGRWLLAPADAPAARLSKR